jgi:dethiobiotin synthetase
VKGFFITGTDTGVGKTWMTAALLHALAARGRRVAGLKPLACGGHPTPDGWRHGDAELMMQHASVALPYATVNPVLLREPIAPHIAARQAGLRLSAAALHEICTTVEEQTDYLLIEGVGGWQVPINDNETMAHVARLLGLPVIMVVGIRLGCLNHSLLTCDAILRQQLTLGGWIANVIDPDMLEIQENIAALEARLPAPRLGTVPHLPHFAAEKIATFLNMDKLSLDDVND